MNFAESSRAAFGELPPVGHVLRSALPTRWLRVHSLPDSKRYPETNLEHDELLRRHRELAVELLGSDRPAILFLHSWGSAAQFAAAFSKFPWSSSLELHRVDPTLYPAPDSDDPDLVVAGFSILWSTPAWDPLIRDVADDRLPSVLLLNPSSGEAYAPYDGGADLFLAAPERVAALAARWSSWRSQRPDGL